MHTDDTGKNIRELVRLAGRELTNRKNKQYFADPSRETADKVQAEYDAKLSQLYSTALYFATTDYIIGTPYVEESATYGKVLYADMRVHNINGALMFRDGELTSHS